MNLFINNRQARLLKIICDNERLKLEDRLTAEEDEDVAMDLKIEISDLKAIDKKLAKHGVVDEITH